MSRSRKKTPSCHVIAKHSGIKKVFNRRLRRNFVVDEYEGVSPIPDGNAYRRMNESYDIDDYHDVGLTFEEFCTCQIARGTFVDEKASRQDYERWYLRK